MAIERKSAPKKKISTIFPTTSVILSLLIGVANQISCKIASSFFFSLHFQEWLQRSDKFAGTSVVLE